MPLTPEQEAELERLRAKAAANSAPATPNYLDNLVPAYRAAREGAGRYLGAESASEAAEKMFKRGSNVRVGEVRSAVERWTPAEREQARIAWLDELRNRSQNIGETHDISIRMFKNPAERQKAELVLSPQDMRQVDAMNLIEGLMAKSRSQVQGNSQTAQRLIAQYGLSPFAVGGAAAGGTGATGGDVQDVATLGGLAFLGRRGQKVLGDRLAREMVQVLSSRDPAAVRAFTHRIAENPALMARLRLLERSIGVGGAQEAAR